MSNIRASQVVGSKLHVRRFPFTLGVVALTLLSAGAAQAEPNANANPNATSNGAVRGVTRTENANYHATKNCGDGTYVMTPQPGTDLMPVDSATPPGVEAFYARAARKEVKWVDTLECVPRNITFAPPGTMQSSNWNGWQIGGYATTPNHYVQGLWYVPSVSVPPYPVGSMGKYVSGTWVGLGGGYYVNAANDSHPLIQSGTEEDVTTSGDISYSFWYEVWPDQNYSFPVFQQGNPNIIINVGDEVGADVFWMPQSNTAQLAVCDFTQSTCANIYISSFHSCNYSGQNVVGVGEPGNTTEWIHEPPMYNGTYQAMPAFSQINFSNSCWGATTTYAIQGDELVGSVNCQPISAGSYQLPIQTIYNGCPISTLSPIGATGSDFYIYNGQ